MERITIPEALWDAISAGATALEHHATYTGSQEDAVLIRKFLDNADWE